MSEEMLERKKKTIVIWCAAITFLLFMCLAAIGEEPNPDAEYCELVRLGFKSDGDLGWYDYDERYSRDCM